MNNKYTWIVIIIAVIFLIIVGSSIAKASSKGGKVVDQSPNDVKGNPVPVNGNTNPPPPPVTVPSGTPIKGYKIYSKGAGSPIWANVNDITPVRFAGYNEYIGIYENLAYSYFGTQYIKVKEGRYIATSNASKVPFY